jgi:hypothetical protein
VGGLGWNGDPPKPQRCGSFVVFSRYPDLGALNWYARREDVIWARDWPEVVDASGPGAKKVVVYPDASIQLIEEEAG